MSGHVWRELSPSFGATKFLDDVRRTKNCVVGQGAVHSYPILRRHKVVTTRVAALLPDLP